MKGRLLLFTLIIAGCGVWTPSTRSRTVIGPDGTPHYAITCKRGIENCYEEAGRLCPRGYDTVDKDSDFKMIPNPYGPILVHRHSMLVRCK